MDPEKKKSFFITQPAEWLGVGKSNFLNRLGADLDEDEPFESAM